MLKNRFAVILTVFLFSLSLGGCLSAKPVLGVLDKEKVAKESKEYKKISTLREEISLLDAALAEKRQEFALQLKDKEVAANKRMQDEWSAKMQDKQNALNQDIQNKNKDFFGSKNVEMKNYVDSVEKELMEKEATLNKEAVATTTTAERRLAINKEISSLEQEARNKVTAKKEAIQKEIDAKVAGDQQQARQELDSYGASLREELFVAERGKSQKYMEELFGEDQKKLNEKQNALEAALKAFNDKVNKAVEKIAKEKKLETVFGAYAVNVKALDITVEVMKELDK